jgi:hypothetical protein
MYVAVDRERMAWHEHPPLAIYLMLLLTALAAALFAGYTMANEPTRNWLFFSAVPTVISVVMYVILDIEFPRLGLIRVNAMDQLLVEVRAAMGDGVAAHSKSRAAA